jgi:hypothetical protein
MVSLRSNTYQIDLLIWTSRVAVELIGQGVLGKSFDSLEARSAVPPYTKTMKEFGCVLNLNMANCF